jgi:carbamoyltransferase
LKKILGIAAFYHDSTATIVVDGEIIASAQEERFTREKHTEVFPTEAIKYCLEETGLSLMELDAIIFYDKPFLKFERLLETYYAFAPKGIFSFLKAMPIWLHEKIFLKKIIWQELNKIEKLDKALRKKLLFSEHHLSHAGSTFFASPFEKAAILTIDGVGEWATASISIGEGNQIRVLKEMNFPHSLGLLYSAFTYYLGFKVNSGEYKLMGLAPFGNSNAEKTEFFIQQIKEKLISIKPDGSLFLNQTYFNYAVGLRMTHNQKWKELFGFSKREAESEILQNHCNLALAIQTVTEEIVLKMASEAKRLTKAENLCLAGGVALNCVANGKLASSNIFQNIFIQPASGDAGGALGAALVANYMYFGEPRNETQPRNNCYLGPDFSEKEITQSNRKNKAISVHYEDFEMLAKEVATHISNGKIVGWFQGRMEFGPRALGNRSILADPRDVEMQQKLNLKIKYREGFRPFAPSVLAEYADEIFEGKADEYMLRTVSIKESLRAKLPTNYYELPLRERLAVKKSPFPSITHLDFSARVQLVYKETNERFWTLIDYFRQQTDCPMLINTSFNVRGEPIVCTPKEAYRCFMATEMDYLVINNFLYKKEEQPNWEDKSRWRNEFKKD